MPGKEEEGYRNTTSRTNQSNNHNDGIPSYEDAIRSGPSSFAAFSSSKASRRNPFSIMRASSDTSNISEASIHIFVYSTIAKALETSLSPSHNPQAFNFWPSDCEESESLGSITTTDKDSTSRDNQKQPEIVSGIPSNIHYSVIRVSDSNFTTALLRQPTTIPEINKTLRTYLSSRGNSVHSPLHNDSTTSSTPDLPTSSSSSTTSSKPPSRSILSLLKDPSRYSSFCPSSPPPQGKPRKLGWRSETEDVIPSSTTYFDQQQNRLQPDEIRVEGHQ